MNLNFHGHSCFSLITEGVNILFDPASSYLKTPGVSQEDFNPDVILVSHGHGDHIADVIEIAKRTSCKVIANYEIVTWLGEKGVDNTMPLNQGGQYNLDFASVKYVNAIHSSVLPDGTNGGNPGGWIVQTYGKTIYYAGDTALTYDMKMLGELYNIDLALLPIGDIFTMGINDAIIASQYINCDRIVGMHYDTFPPISIDKTKAISDFRNANKELILLNINETLEI